MPPNLKSYIKVSSINRILKFWWFWMFNKTVSINLSRNDILKIIQRSYFSGALLSTQKFDIKKVTLYQFMFKALFCIYLHQECPNTSICKPMVFEYLEYVRNYMYMTKGDIQSIKDQRTLGEFEFSFLRTVFFIN